MRGGKPGKRSEYGDGNVYQPRYPGEVKPPADRNWYVTWYDKDGNKQRATKRKHGSPFRSRREAQEFLKLMLADAVKGGTPTHASGLHYADLREMVLKHHRQQSSKSLEVLSNGEESLRGLTELDVYGGIKERNPDSTYTVLQGKGRKLSTITKDDWFENFVIRRYKEGVGKAVINHSAKILRHGLRLVKMDSLVDEVKLVSAASPREDCLYIEDFRRLIGENGPAFIAKEFHPILKFLFYQGVRISEALGITWNQIDFESGEYRPHKTSTKTGNTEPKPLNPAEILPMLRKMKSNAKETDLVFGAVRSEGENPAKRLEGAFRNAMLEMKPISGFGKNKGPAGSFWNCAQCQTIDRTLPPPTDNGTAHACTNKQSEICLKYRVPMQWSYCGPSVHSLRASCAVYYLEKSLTETEVIKVTGHKDMKVFRGYARLKLENIAAEMSSEGRLKSDSL